MLVGQDRSGKTSLKKSLKGICFNPEEESTVGIDLDRYHFQVTTEMWTTGKKNEEGDVDKEAISFEENVARLAANTLKKIQTVSEFRREHIADKGDYDLEETDGLLEAIPGDKTVGPEEIESTEDRLSTKHNSGESFKAVGEAPDQKPEENLLYPTPEQESEFQEIAARIERKLKLEEEKEDEDIYSILWDFAGQSVYYVTHPLFLTARAIYFLVYDLSQNPDEKAKPLVKQGVYKKSQDSFNLKTNLDYLDFWMHSLASLAFQHPSHGQDLEPGSDVLPQQLPVVFLVCTHADKPYRGRDPFEIANEVYGTLKERPYGTHLFDVYCVDNTKSGSESECQEVKRLRQDVLSVSKELPHVKEVIPVKWLKYEKTLQCMKKEGQKWISLATAKCVACNQCEIESKDEFKTLLNFLHDLRILIHFDDTAELKDMVVLDTQWLIDVFKKVITVKPYHWKEKPFVDLWCRLEKEGILEEKLLEHVWKPLILHKETSESLIAIMERFSLLCSWPLPDVSGNKQYLVPSMLKSHPPEAVMNLVSTAHMPSLVLKFESGKVPSGLFPRLVLQFFLWGKEMFWSSAKPKMYHSFVRFFLSKDAGGSVILLCHSCYIEVVYHRGSVGDGLGNALRYQRSMDICYNEHELTSVRVICRQFGLILECMRNQFCWLNSMRYTMGIICPVCREQSANDYCDKHQSLDCKEEDCLHFWSQSDLFASKGEVFCDKSVCAHNSRFSPERWAPWFPPQDDQVIIITKLQKKQVTLILQVK